MKRSSLSFSRLLLAPVLAFSACVPDQTEPTPSAGSLDMSRYVAVGGLYSAGFSNGGVTSLSQRYSYPNMLAYQFSLAQPGISFVQPLVEGTAGTGYLKLQSISALGVPVTEQVPAARTTIRAKYGIANSCGTTDTTYLYSRAQGLSLPNNLSVPGLRLTQIATPGLGLEANAATGAPFNSYFERLLPASDSRSYLQAVSESKATFFTAMVGLEDLLPYALKGGECTQRPTTTSNDLIIANLSVLLDALTANNRPGAVATIPSLKTLPYFQLGAGDKVQNRARTATGNSQIVVYIISSLTNEARPITNDDIVLPAYLELVGQPVTYTNPDGTQETLLYGMDARAPIARAQVLDATEFGRVDPIIGRVNAALKTLTDPKTGKYKVALVDVNQLFINVSGVSGAGGVSGGVNINGVEYSGDPVRGNFFSLDLYSLTPRGNGLVANEFLRQINSYYRANLPLLDVNTLPTTSLPD
ncbi:hypothetical protein HER32_05740 [Hymenobacter sp. BT18]|uniref:hypothetical protein n=1 Tax=Hymenobacter sp. BT18 TaxID=2835648 RepID=UPI00143EA360|nr:hypothetical protein [Hymenobacter sp. BT18]QIX60701.1 hypothetical protein HER32_05740 [Hymenobacter sp. BT18]